MVSQKITKEVFISVIEYLHQQYLQDKEYVEGISALYGTDMPFYDNSHSLKANFTLLRMFFPKDENGFCDIEHFCYVCDFGKIGEVKDASELYDRLISEQIEKANKKYDLERQNCECKSKEKQCMFCYMHGLNTPTFDLSGVVAERVKPEQKLFAMAKKVSDSFGLPRETIIEVVRISESDGSVVKKTMAFGEWLSYKKLPGFIYKAYQVGFSSFQYMNCLEYLLDLWNRGHRFTILYNGDHCIGVNDKKIFELGSAFKKELLSGYSLNGGNSYIEITSSYSFDSLVRCFNLPPHYFMIAKEYYESVKVEV